MEPKSMLGGGGLCRVVGEVSNVFGQVYKSILASPGGVFIFSLPCRIGLVLLLG